MPLSRAERNVLRAHGVPLPVERRGPQNPERYTLLSYTENGDLLSRSKVATVDLANMIARSVLKERSVGSWVDMIDTAEANESFPTTLRSWTVKESGIEYYISDQEKNRRTRRWR